MNNAYTLIKGKTKVHIRILEETAEMTRSVGDTIDTSKTVLTPTEAIREVNRLMREGYRGERK